jgi:hypothetical protein
MSADNITLMIAAGTIMYALVATAGGRADGDAGEVAA